MNREKILFSKVFLCAWRLRLRRIRLCDSSSQQAYSLDPPCSSNLGGGEICETRRSTSPFGWLDLSTTQAQKQRVSMESVPTCPILPKISRGRNPSHFGARCGLLPSRTIHCHHYHHPTPPQTPLLERVPAHQRARGGVSGCRRQQAQPAPNPGGTEARCRTLTHPSSAGALVPFRVVGSAVVWG